MTDQLRECPFCNGDGELDIDENHNHFVSCIECRAEGSRAACASDAANAWNTRPTAVAYRAEGENKPFGWWIEAEEWATEGGNVRQFVRDRQFIELLQQHGIDVKEMPLFTHPPRSGDEAEPTVRNFRIVEDARDAARYRWLRQPNAIRREAHIAVLTENGGYVATEEMADRAIDAAKAIQAPAWLISEMSA